MLTIRLFPYFSNFGAMGFISVVRKLSIYNWGFIGDKLNPVVTF